MSADPAPQPVPDAATVKRSTAVPALLERWRWMTFPLVAFLFSRAAIFGLTGTGLLIEPRTGTGYLINKNWFYRLTAPLEEPFFSGLCWWDCNWYRSVGEEGYTVPERAAFFPLFPLLSKVVSTLTTIPMTYAMILVANLAALAAYGVIYKIFRELEGEAAARIGLMMVITWPFAFIHAAPYPETLMMLSTSGAILLAMRQKHILAGTVLGFGILARHLTIFGGIALLVAQLRERGFHPKRFIFHPAFLGLLVPFVIAGLYPLYNAQHYGDPWLWWTARGKYWGELAWSGLPQFFTNEGWEPHIKSYVAFSVIPAAGSLMLLRKKDHWILAGFALGLMLVVYTVGVAALGRYSASCWPAFLPLAVWLSKRPGYEAPVIAAFAVLQGLYLFLFSHSYPIN